MSNPKRKLFDDHPELIGWWSCNNTLDPDKLSKGSTKRALWWCGKHEWPAVVQNMVKGSRCPYCSGNLAIPGETDIFTTNPDLTCMWSVNNTLDPKSLKASSNKRALWWCGAHEWEATIGSISSGTRCPYCSGRRAIPGRTDIFSVYPNLRALWSSNNTVDPSTLKPTSHVSALWTCGLHEWSADLGNVVAGTRCPSCSGRVATADRNLAVLFPDLALEWSPSNVTQASDVAPSSGKTAEWVCSADPGHVWSARVYSRTSKSPTGCPICNPPGSKMQHSVSEFIDEIRPDLKIQENVKGLCRGRREVDIYIPELEVAFEFNGVRWHSSRFNKSSPTHEKEADCSAKGIDLYTIWDDDWSTRRGVIQRWISQILGEKDQMAYDPSMCIVSEVSTETAQRFLDSYHPMGFVRGTIYVGLVYGGNLSSVAVFEYRHDGPECTLLRYASCKDIPGGFTRIQEYVVNNTGIPEMSATISLECDKGKYLVDAGWVIHSILPPALVYSYKDVRIDRRYAKDLPDEELHLVHDSGSVRYVREVNPYIG